MSGWSPGRLASLLERIARDPFHCYLAVNPRAREEQAEGVRRGGPLAGVPVAVKDNLSTRGLATTCASRILQGYLPPYDAHVVEGLRRSGAAVVGKTNMDEFAMGSTGEWSGFGPTRNPWDPDRVPGGSSGGSGAAVAAGLAPLALGSDTGGSVRCPASFCGVTGLKPTYGLVSRYGLVAYANSLDQVGPIARTAEELAPLLEAIATEDPRDPTQAKGVPRTGYAAALREGVSDLSIGVVREMFQGITKPVERAVRDAIGLLAEAGAEVEEVSLDAVKWALPAYYTIAVAEASSNLSRFDGLRYGLHPPKGGDWNAAFSEVRGAGFGPEVRRRILLGTYALSAGYYGRYYLKALRVRALLREQFEEALQEHDLLATPTMPFTAPRLGEKIADPLALYAADVETVPVNLAGVPALSIPCGFERADGRDLPIGLQLIGRPFEERTLFRAGYAFQKRTDFVRWPPGCGPS
ncbi:MAG: Asp-tRNA(Asn)/Glu-tRNA(Gln) amidotransferase subunit GatA [Halobacteria archaeon]